MKSNMRQRELEIHTVTAFWIPPSNNKIDTIYKWFPKKLEYIDRQEILRLFSEVTHAANRLERKLTVNHKVIVICKMFKNYLVFNKLKTDRNIEEHIASSEYLYKFWLYLKSKPIDSFIAPIAEAEMGYL